MAEPTWPHSLICTERSPLAALAAVGLTSVIGQLLLLRELVAVFYGNELVLGLILAIWLAWVAAGAWGLGRISRRGGVGTLASGLAAVAVILPVQLALARASRDLVGVTPGALVPLGPMLTIITVTLAPLCLLVGLQFTLAARLMAEQGGTVGRAYTAESVGAMFGGLLFSFALVRWLDPYQIALAVGALNLFVVAQLMAHKRWIPLLCALALLMSALPLGAWLNRQTLRWQYPGLRFARDSVYGRIVVTGTGAQRVFYENGMLFFETQGVRAEEVAHLPLLAHPEPRRVLLVGGGVAGTLSEVLRHPTIDDVYYVELDPLVLSAARSELPPDQAAALADPRVRIIHADGRRTVRNIGKDLPVPPLGTFDVIIVDLPEPATGQLNRFYTKEFYAEARRILAPGGILALTLPWQENYPGPALQQLGASLFQTLVSELREVLVLPGDRLVLLASERSLESAPDVLSQRLVERGLATKWVVRSYLHYLLTTDRVAQAHLLLEGTGAVRLNRDLQPVSYFYALAVWLSRFYRGLSRPAAGLSALRLAWLAVPLAAGVVLVRLVPMTAPRRRAARVAAAMALIGLAGMVLQVIVLVGFQAVHGYLYGQVGLIVTAFMAGLAAGSAFSSRWLQPRAQEGRPRTRLDPRANPVTALIWVLVAILLLALALAALLGMSPAAGFFPALGLVAGGLGGMAFPLAVACLERTPSESGRVAGLLYGSDLAGACLGTVLASALLVPVLGLPQTCLAVALVAAGGVCVLM